MVFKPTDIFNVIERIGAMAKEALIYSCMLLPRDHSVHHHEVVHVVAWRCLMALRAILRGRRWMQEPRNSPGIEFVAARAVPSEQTPVRLSIAVTVGAVETSSFPLVGLG